MWDKKVDELHMRTKCPKQCRCFIRKRRLLICATSRYKIWSEILFLQNISHYYNNICTFHVHMFTTFVLSLNKFMVIAYNHNLHFIIHCKKFQKQDYNSFHHNRILQKIQTKDEHKIHYRSLCFSVLLKTWIQIIAWSHVLLNFFPKQHLKYDLWFSTTNTSSCSYYYLKLIIFASPFILPCFSKLSPFELSQITSSMILTTRIKIQINKTLY